ncbi:uncharacterized protein METZ01_LOCUS190029 [marine metagenome]|uniref:Uncharacterized protein n=1 Tax=marine metagenome TaxID=408172 RepID=A0A382DG10_9ZZZZ
MASENRGGLFALSGLPAISILGLEFLGTVLLAIIESKPSL